MATFEWIEESPGQESEPSGVHIPLPFDSNLWTIDGPLLQGRPSSPLCRQRRPAFDSGTGRRPPPECVLRGLREQSARLPVAQARRLRRGQCVASRLVQLR